MKATRDGFGDQLVESGGDHYDIVVLGADLGKATKINKFAEKYPDRYFECGIAENNMIGIGSGLAANGYNVFMSSFASFLTGKYDTIRCSIAYPDEPVILVGTHGGMAIGKDGVTQMGLEDVAIMRALPNMMVINPATYSEARYWTKWLCEVNPLGPVYLRLGRQPVKEVFPEDWPFAHDNTIKQGKSSTLVFTTGCILPDALEATEELDVTIIHVPVLRPIDSGWLYYTVRAFDHIFTVEDHSIIGGLGSLVAEHMAEAGSHAKLVRIGLNDQFPESGPPEQLYEKYGLSANKIKEKIIKYAGK